MVDAVAAVDLGATSGRVMIGHVGENELTIRPVRRFTNSPVHTVDGLHWDILDLYGNVLTGLRTAIRDEPRLRGISVDSWAVDYALMRDGRILGAPFHYRDERNFAAVATVRTRISDEELYARNGLQFLPFNTLYQLTADAASGALAKADAFLLIPDLINFWLTGEQRGERTNASTTGLLGVRSLDWDSELIARLGLPSSIFPTLVSAGTQVGKLLPEVAVDLGSDRELGVVAVGSHDTASAVVAVPSLTADFAYISCGTWGLVGVELDAPVLSEASRRANFTNESGVDGRVRFLHNVMGLWLLSESVRTWEEEGESINLPELIDAASDLTESPSIFDVNDQRFLSPGDMPARIEEWCVENDIAAPRTRAAFVRSIVESLADAFAKAVTSASALSGRTVSVIHIVGGGSQNGLLCQLIANRSGLPVLAGPVEATTIGNVLVQARVHGLVTGSIESLRSIVAAAYPPTRFSPQT